MIDNTLLSIFGDHDDTALILDFLAQNLEPHLSRHISNVWSFTSNLTDREIFEPVKQIAGDAEVFICRIGSRDWCSNRKSSSDCYEYLDEYAVVSIHSATIESYDVLDHPFKAGDDCHSMTNLLCTRTKLGLHRMKDILVEKIGPREYELFLCNVPTGETLTFVQRQAGRGQPQPLPA